MAQKVHVLLVDDLDGGDADQTVTFALDGTTYEIDLSDENAERLRRSLAEFTANGRKLKRGQNGAAHAPSPRSSADNKPPVKRIDPAERSAIQAFAESIGKRVGEKGRIAEPIMQEWIAAGRPGL